MSHGEPLSGDPRSAPFLIGQNSRGQWVVQDPSGLHGGLFADRIHAMKYAMSENGNRPRSVVMVAGVLELDMSAKPAAPAHPADNQQTRHDRVA